MIEKYATGSFMKVQGNKYRQDLKIIRGQVKDNWWRKQGHRLDKDDIIDILAAGPKVLVVGTGYAGNMRVPQSLRALLEDRNIKVIAQETPDAAQTFNSHFTRGNDVAGAFHLTC